MNKLLDFSFQSYAANSLLPRRPLAFHFLPWVGSSLHKQLSYVYDMSSITFIHGGELQSLELQRTASGKASAPCTLSAFLDSSSKVGHA